MNYIVRVYLEGFGIKSTNYFEINDKEEAVAYADKRAKQAREDGYEFDISIYEITNY